ncbi:MAG TPA: fused MFS/spermidine synthase [Solirubrobacteraceae bacterium]|jgi:predicted membrane-bound spermidine synthase
MSRRGLEALVFCVGAATLGAEIAAARLIAPAFGASTVVWANTIAVVLLALAVGYWAGGRLADRHPRGRSLSAVVLAAAALLACVPLAAVPLLGGTQDALSELWGSLLAVLLLVAPPVLVLGTVAPWAIRLRLAAIEDAGEVAGRVYALSTAGSLAGTFAAALVLLPLIGTRLTFLSFAALLAAAAVPGMMRR